MRYWSNWTECKMTEFTNSSIVYKIQEFFLYIQYIEIYTAYIINLRNDNIF